MAKFLVQTQVQTFPNIPQFFAIFRVKSRIAIFHINFRLLNMMLVLINKKLKKVRVKT